jgi:hypothetical protein
MFAKAEFEPTIFRPKANVADHHAMPAVCMYLVKGFREMRSTNERGEEREREREREGGEREGMVESWREETV